MSPTVLYIFAFLAALILSLILTPAARAAAILFNIFDHPITSVKTHKEPVPYLGGLAIFIAFSFSLLWVRLLTSFPTGTLRTLRGLLIGGGLVFLMGLVDDIRHGGLGYRSKFLIQISAALILVFFGVQIKFIQPGWLGVLVSVIWIVGVTNAFNIIDIMDGLSSGSGAIAALFFLGISLPTEDIYVNFAAAALAGGALGFIPYNLSKKWRIFMGDSGSLLIGFIAAALSLGTNYSETSQWAILAPLFILVVPIFDTALVFFLRIRKGKSPFLGSKDHFPLRLEALGWKRPRILMLAYFMSVAGGLAAYLSTRLDGFAPLWVFFGCFFALFLLVKTVLRVSVE